MCSTMSKLYLLERIGKNFIPVPMDFQNKYRINTENLTIEYEAGAIGLMDYYSQDPLYRGKFKVRITAPDGSVIDRRDIDTTDEALEYIDSICKETV